MNTLIILRIKKLLRILLSLNLSKVLFKYRVAAATEHISVIKACEFNVLFDIGSNRGQFALIARSLKSELELYCFEPQVNAFEILNKVFSKQDGFTSFNKGVGSVEGRRAIFVARSDDSSSYLQPSQEQILLSRSSRISNTIETEIMVLDQFIHIIRPKDLVFLKIDVQGFEYEVLLGGHNFLQHVEYIYCESSFVELYLGQKLFSEISCHLSEYGFVVKGFFNEIYNSDGELIQADILFQKSKP